MIVTGLHRHFLARALKYLLRHESVVLGREKEMERMGLVTTIFQVKVTPLPWLFSIPMGSECFLLLLKLDLTD